MSRHSSPIMYLPTSGNCSGVHACQTEYLACGQVLLEEGGKLCPYIQTIQQDGLSDGITDGEEAERENEGLVYGNEHEAQGADEKV